MHYFIYGITYNGGRFSVDKVFPYNLEDEVDKMESTIRYFGGGSVTIYDIDYDSVNISSHYNVVSTQNEIDDQITVDDDSEI
jgi:hypothetical protein